VALERSRRQTQPSARFSQTAGFPKLLGENFAGVIIRDGWAPSRRFTQAVHQTCLAHLIRRCRLPQAEHPRVRFVHAARTMLQQALAPRDRSHAGCVTAHGLAVARGHLVNRVNQRLDQPGSVPDVQRSRRISPLNFWPSSPSCSIRSPSMPQWRAAQALRPAVVTRKVCGGNRSSRGAANQQILASVLRAAQQRRVDVQALLVSFLRSPESSVSRELQSPKR
jgi:transposase